jgi:hypothetical protein
LNIIHKVLNNFCINSLLFSIILKKQYFIKLKQKLFYFKTLNYKLIIFNLFKKSFNNKVFLVNYIIYICFKKSNTFLHILDCLGNQVVFYSIGLLKYNKKLSKFIILEKFSKLILFELNFLKNNTVVSIYLKNFDFNYKWFLNKIKKKLYIICVDLINSLPYNGCRKKKLKRIKLKKWLSWFKAADCKFVEFFIIGSNPIFFNYRNMTQFGSVLVLGISCHVFKSHYFEISFFS